MLEAFVAPLHIGQDSLCAACDVDPADPAGDQEPCPATVLEAKAFFLNRCEELGWKARHRAPHCAVGL